MKEKIKFESDLIEFINSLKKYASTDD